MSPAWPTRRCPFTTICGSNADFRSRGTEIRTGLSSASRMGPGPDVAAIVFPKEPFRDFPTRSPPDPLDIAKMIVHFRAQRPLDHPRRQLADKPPGPSSSEIPASCASAIILSIAASLTISASLFAAASPSWEHHITQALARHTLSDDFLQLPDLFRARRRPRLAPHAPKLKARGAWAGHQGELPVMPGLCDPHGNGAQCAKRTARLQENRRRSRTNR
jgi:hypothetical protein